MFERALLVIDLEVLHSETGGASYTALWHPVVRH